MHISISNRMSHATHTNQTHMHQTIHTHTSARKQTNIHLTDGCHSPWHNSNIIYTYTHTDSHTYTHEGSVTIIREDMRRSKNGGQQRQNNKGDIFLHVLEKNSVHRSHISGRGIPWRDYLQQLSIYLVVPQKNKTKNKEPKQHTQYIYIHVQRPNTHIHKHNGDCHNT